MRSVVPWLSPGLWMAARSRLQRRAPRPGSARKRLRRARRSPGRRRPTLSERRDALFAPGSLRAMLSQSASEAGLQKPRRNQPGAETARYRGAGCQASEEGTRNRPCLRIRSCTDGTVPGADDCGSVAPRRPPGLRRAGAMCHRRRTHARKEFGGRRRWWAPLPAVALIAVMAGCHREPQTPSPGSAPAGIATTGSAHLPSCNDSGSSRWKQIYPEAGGQ
jgi:hypothetical protein